MEEKRESLGSRLGFILLSAGCAIGIGNVWKFPWMAGQHGGGLFVLIYLFFLIALGVPLLVMEFAAGRAARRSIATLHETLTPERRRLWSWHGGLGMAGCWLLMMFYTTVAGWMLLYLLKTACGTFAGLDAKGVADAFGACLADPVQQLAGATTVSLAGFAVCACGLRTGLERITKWMMLALLALMGVLAINSLCLEGGGEGLAFYLKPSLSALRESGVGRTVVGAMNQAFFTLSIGIGCMTIFGSYIGRERSLAGEALTVTVLDTVVALLAGLIIFPACSAFGVRPDAGPSLIFVTLPNVFNAMSGGLHHGAGRLRKPARELARKDWLVAPQGSPGLRHGDAHPLRAVRARIQPAPEFPSPRRTINRARPGGLSRQRPCAAHRRAGVRALLHASPGMGMGQVPRRGERRARPQTPRMGEALVCLGHSNRNRRRPAHGPVRPLLRLKLCSTWSRS